MGRRKQIKTLCGHELKVGQVVRWLDPEKAARDLSVNWNVDEIVSEEMIRISNDYGQAEVFPDELFLAPSPKSQMFTPTFMIYQGKEFEILNCNVAFDATEYKIEIEPDKYEWVRACNPDIQKVWCYANGLGE